MADVQITYWRDIPSLVTAQEGRRNRHRVELSARFQVAIDEAAMRLELIGTDAYLAQWRKGDWQPQEGDPVSVAEAVAAEIERDYPPARLRELLAALTPASND